MASLRRHKALILAKNVLYMQIMNDNAAKALPSREHYFSRPISTVLDKRACDPRKRSGRKTRHKSKKGAAGMSRSSKKSAVERRTSHAPRGAVRPGAPAAKITGARKAAGEGVLPGMPINKKTTQRQGFKTNEFIVYPAHGVGQILAIEEQEIAGAKLELFVINFIKDKMTLRVPTAKIVSVGMAQAGRAAAGQARARDAQGPRAHQAHHVVRAGRRNTRPRSNGCDIVAIAEVVRDLFRSDTQPEQSYSERQLYEAALDRLSREISAVQKITETEAIKEIEAALAKGPRRRSQARR